MRKRLGTGSGVATGWGPGVIVSGAVVLGLLLSGCNEAEQKKQLAELQAKADKRLSDAESSAKERMAELQKQLDTLKAEAAAVTEKAKAEADEAATKAQASVDDAAKETAKALDTARTAFKGEGKARYQALNSDLAEVTAKAGKIPAKSKAAYDTAIKTVVALQKDISKDIAAYDTATLETFSKAKHTLDIDLAKYKSAIKTAKAKVP
jgi:uncharacterized protein YicC (UPF0701 family)